MKKLFFVSPNLYLPDEITLVGSSKFILKSKKGNEIDLSNYVVRFNFAKTEGYEEFVGSKTSLMVINNNQYLKLDSYSLEQKKIRKCLVITPHELKRYDYAFETFFFEKKISQFYLSLYFTKHVKIFINLIQILRKKNFSIGFCFILLCLASGVKINVYGFDLEEDMTQRTHYYKNQSIGHVHNLSAEHTVLKKLKKHKLVKFNK